MICSVNNGCIESAVLEEGFLSFAAGRGHLLEYGLSDDDVIGVDLSCGGQIRVFEEPLNLHWWSCLEPIVRACDVAYTVTVIGGHDRRESPVRRQHDTHLPNRKRCN